MGPGVQARIPRLSRPPRNGPTGQSPRPPTNLHPMSAPAASRDLVPASIPTPAPADLAPFRLGLRVYWEDTDAGGVVFYANYLKFFERARTEWLRSLGVSQEALRVGERAQLVVLHTEVRYVLPARLDDWLEVSAHIEQSGRASVTVWQQAWRDADLLCEGRIRIACVDAEQLKPRRLPDAITQILPIRAEGRAQR